jgi:EpsI family protein
LVLARWSFDASSVTAIAQPSLPQHVGIWRATAEEQLDANVLASIDPDAYVIRLYEAPGQAPITIYVGFYAGRAGYGKGAHDPEVCYPAQGWEILSSDPHAVPLANAESLSARLLRVHHQSRKDAVIYWFQPAARWPADGATEQALRLLDAATGRPQYAFVRLSVPSNGNPAAVEELSAFAGEIAAAVRAAVENLTNATS